MMNTSRCILFGAAAFLLFVFSAVYVFSDGEESKYKLLRESMVKNQIEARGVKNELVLHAMRTVKRHLFVPAKSREYAYRDSALPIAENQTISQPYIVALMTELLQSKPEHSILEIGTGSGYQAAVLAEICGNVYTIEIVEPLAKQAKSLLTSLGYQTIQFKTGDGYQGWEEHAPFDGIMVTAAPKQIPQPLVEQLKEGGRMVIPVGDQNQTLMLLTKKGGVLHKKEIIPVRFVPMTGEALKK